MRLQISDAAARMLRRHDGGEGARILRGGRLTRLAGRVVSLAPLVAAGTVIVLGQSGAAQAQTVTPLDCVPGSYGPDIGSPQPFPGGMCDLGTFEGPNVANSWAWLGGGSAISADGTVVVGESEFAGSGGGTRAFRWSGTDGVMQDLGSLGTGDNDRSEAEAVSADGRVVVGSTFADNGDFPLNRAFRWTLDDGVMVDLGSLRTDGQGNSRATNVSGDGRTVIGSAENDEFSSVAFRWTEASGQMEALGSLRTIEGDESRPASVSFDGRVIVGYALDDDGMSRAFRWVEGQPGILDLGTFRSDNSGSSDAVEVSADGSTVIGWAESDTSFSRAFLWRDGATGLVELGTLRAGPDATSTATAVSADGRVIVGHADTDDSFSVAFRWEDGEMISLGTLQDGPGGSSRANAISADGTTIVGNSSTNEGPSRAFRWTDDGTGMLDLGTLRSDNLGSSNALGVSADGSVIVGESESDNSDYRVFVWRGVMQDYENLIISLPELANDIELAMALPRLPDDTCFAGRERRSGAPAGFVLSDAFVDTKYDDPPQPQETPTEERLVNDCFAVSGIRSSIGADSGAGLGSRSAAIGQLTYGRGVTEALTLGGTLAIFDGSLSGAGVDPGRGWGASLWADYSEDGLAQTGWQASAALGFGSQGNDLARGVGLDGVEVAMGEADITSRGMSLSLGYGLALQNGWLLTPHAGISHQRTTLDAFAEDPEATAFSASYERLRLASTIGSLGLTGETRIGEASHLVLGAGLDADLDADRVVLSGTSNIPGLAEFGVASTLARNGTRPYLSAEYRIDIAEDQAITGSARIGTALFGDAPQVDLGLRYGVRF